MARDPFSFSSVDELIRVLEDRQPNPSSPFEKGYEAATANFLKWLHEISEAA